MKAPDAITQSLAEALSKSAPDICSKLNLLLDLKQTKRNIMRFSGSRGHALIHGMIDAYLTVEIWRRKQKAKP